MRTHNMAYPTPFPQVVSLTKSSDVAPYHALQQGEEAHWEVCERLLFIYSKLNKGLRYVQVREMTLSYCTELTVKDAGGHQFHPTTGCRSIGRNTPPCLSPPSSP